MDLEGHATFKLRLHRVILSPKREKNGTETGMISIAENSLELVVACVQRH